MRKIVALALLLTAAAPASAAQLNWVQGWDIFNEPLGGGGVVYQVSGRDLTVTFSVRGAVPNKLYQVGVHLGCTNQPRFGQFPSGLPCSTITRDGNSHSIQAAELGVMTTDATGAGSTIVTVRQLPSATYQVHFTARNGVGCNVHAGPEGPSVSANCPAVYRAPAPFGNFAKIKVP
jgi:hypothetical protein